MDFFTDNSQAIMISAVFLMAALLLLGLWRVLSPRLLTRRGQRLGVTEYYEIDRTRRLVLVRRDNVEHLLLIGAQQDLVIETAIPLRSPVEPVVAAASPATAASSPIGQTAAAAAVPPTQPGAARPAPRSPILPDRKPIPPITAPREDPRA